MPISIKDISKNSTHPSLPIAIGMEKGKGLGEESKGF